MPLMADKNHRIHKYQIVAFAILLILMIFLTQANTLSWGFSFIDSPVILAQGILYSPYEYFLSPYSYQFLSPNNLTPWVTLSWEADYQLFGLDTLGFRIHHLASMALMVLLIFLLLTAINVPPFIAFVFCWAACITPSALEVVALLPNRHYIEGLIFCLLSVLCVIKYNRQKHYMWLIFSASFYMMAATAKEIYVPLPGIVFFMLEGSLRSRLYSIAPYAMVTAAYVGWRFYMLGGSLGGYQLGEFTSYYTSSDLLVSVIAKVIVASFGSPAFSLSILGAFILVAAFSYSNLSLNVKLGAVIGTVWLLIPIFSLIPVIAFFGVPGRWTFLPVTVLLTFFAYLCSVAPRLLGMTVVLMVLAWTIYSTYGQIKEAKTFPSNSHPFEASILSANRTVFIQNSSKYSRIAAHAVGSWVNLSRIHQQRWGTLVLMLPPQQLYHDLTGRSMVDPNLKPMFASDLLVKVGQLSLESLVDSASYDASTELITFRFKKLLTDQSCFIYIFGENNGVPLGLPSCEHWQVSPAQLSIWLRKIGYPAEDASISVWQGSGASLIASKPYSLNDLLRDNGIDIKVIPHE